MKFEIGDYVRLRSHHQLNGIVTWVDPEVDAEGRVIHIKQGKETYRANEDSLELVFPK